LKRVRPLKIAVLGSAITSEDSAPGRKAYEIGAGIAAREGVVFTGGCPGLPHAAVLGARDSGGLTVGVSPAMNIKEHETLYGYPGDSAVLVFTGMGTKGRNVILIRSADACVFIGGGMGTLNEFTIAFDELGPECAIGVLRGTDGLSGEFGRIAKLTEKAPAAQLHEDTDPQSLVDKIFTHISF
jgi:uncharacterized protein (TIGR00725 family)